MPESAFEEHWFEWCVDRGLIAWIFPLRFDRILLWFMITRFIRL